MRIPPSAELVIWVSPLRLGCSSFLSFHRLLHKPYLNRVSIWIYVWICSCLVLSPPFSNKSLEKHLIQKTEWVFLRATSGMVKHISCLGCVWGYNLDIQYFLSVFFFNFVFCSQFGFQNLRPQYLSSKNLDLSLLTVKSLVLSVFRSCCYSNRNSRLSFHSKHIRVFFPNAKVIIWNTKCIGFRFQRIPKSQFFDDH